MEKSALENFIRKIERASDELENMTHSYDALSLHDDEFFEDDQVNWCAFTQNTHNMQNTLCDVIEYLKERVNEL